MIRSSALRPIRASAMDNAGAECGYSYTLAQQQPEGSTWTEYGNTYDAELEQAIRLGVEPKTSWLAVGWAVLRSDYPQATWEVKVRCQLVDPETGDKLTPDGTGESDLVGTLPGGGLVVVDLKSGYKPVPHPDANYQIRGYGVALCLARGASRFQPVVWQPNVSGIVRGRWHEDGADWWDVINAYRRAAQADPELPIVGDHCMRCYQSRKCRAFMLPDSLAETELAPLTGGAITLGPGNVLAVLRKYLWLEEASKKLRNTLGVVLRDYARSSGGITDEAGGRTWGPVLTRNRRSLSLERVQDEAPDLYEQLEARGLVTGGGMSERYSWRNTRGAKTQARMLASEGDATPSTALDTSGTAERE